jgi:hypothetical protein
MVAGKSVPVDELARTSAVPFTVVILPDGSVIDGSTEYWMN